MVSNKPAIYFLTDYFRYTGWNAAHPKFYFETFLGTDEENEKSNLTPWTDVNMEFYLLFFGKLI